MLRSARSGCFLVVVGVGIALYSLRFTGFTTHLYCPGMDTLAFELLRFLPGRAEITGFSVPTMTLHWQDGCNRRANSLVPVIFGLATSIGGLVVVRSDRFHDAEQDP